ncbi:MAG: transcription-repair coupling factor [Candidatus Cloacimonetes bacterium]|nr:transcription-repair coupling factor [Candidatus Cloacimonadota bacterium]
MNIETNNFYQKIERFLSQNPEILKLEKSSHNKSNSCCNINHINQSMKTIIASHILNQTEKTILYVTKDDKQAEDITEDFIVLTNNQQVSFIPDYETIPYEDRSPHYMIRAQRIRALTNLLSKEKHIFCLSYRNLIRSIINPDIIKSNIKNISITQEYDLSDLVKFLSNCGYENSTQIEKVGQFSKRGGILDIFSPNYTLPIRMEFFGDEVISIRHFSVSTQRSEKYELKNVVIIPCREAIIDDNIENKDLYEMLSQKGFYEGIETHIPLFEDKKYTLFDYINPEESIIFFDNFNFDYDFQKAYIEEIAEAYQNIQQKKSKQHICKPDKFILNEAELLDTFNKYQINFLNSSILFLPNNFINNFNKQIEDISLHTEPIPVINSDLQVLENHINDLSTNNYDIFIQLENFAQRNRMIQLLDAKDSKISFTIGVFHKGFISHDFKFAVFTDHEIFKRIKHKKLDLMFSKSDALVDYESLKIGDYIVHIEHGIGIYEGLKKIQIGDKFIECLSIQYAGTDKVYVPTWQLKLVSKYVSDEGTHPIIHKLGGKAWEATKHKARKQIELVVDDIVNLYAERSLREGIRFQEDTEWQYEMENSFTYEDTPDQRKATQEIKEDMEKSIPMERLLCGDVGFGKTEVAIRAAFKAVLSGYQVAVLVPTTLLAEQHFYVFKERLAQFPVKISMLSRFRSPAMIDKDLIKIRNGEIDIIIGTHRILSKDVVFKKIGLLIIDEEHRFGVKHKEKIRKIKSNVDTLYMSATPIPRTMNMVLSKLKNMSLIQTSPKARLPIRTVIVPYDNDVIKDAILREVDRGGQVFFIHNRVETIESIYSELKKLLPNIRFIVGHGQLPEKRLEKILVDFSEHKYDVLIATTIIESGIDIPNANTILVNRADMFGLAQLYQIRGRVGRSNKRAYAYLIIPKKLSDIARKRLETLTEYESLGAGYQIAMRDLEIRGAGALLGTKQSGIITSVGFNYYNKLLNQAVTNIIDNNPKGIWYEEEDSDMLRNIEIGSDFYFPPNFITDEKQKLQIYKRMLEFESNSEFDDLKNELLDRFGKIPITANAVIEYFRIRFYAKKLGLKNFMILSKKMLIEYDKNNFPPRNILNIIISKSKYPVQFDTTNSLKILFQFPENNTVDTTDKIKFALKIINILSEEKSE